MKPFPSRRRSREMAVTALYQAAISQASAHEVATHIRDQREFTSADPELFTKLFFGAYNNQKNYMQHIRHHLDRDEKDLSPIERAVLLVATHELVEMPETPFAVVINEAIEVTKTYGGTDGHKFVNGILDKLAAELRPNDPKKNSAS